MDKLSHPAGRESDSMLQVSWIWVPNTHLQRTRQKRGGENHKSVDCAEQPKCFLCTSDKDAKNGLPHISGSGVLQSIPRCTS
ncbi:unnamed protein product [Euphydryas editha]|uniref:Uncharacterized protein n=1 Tax=Euphydryas editha TaxID=104508 RepID=A0AAU9VDM9_EUPED|nr:unnamed protein product [Euphydryas editha]